MKIDQFVSEFKNYPVLFIGTGLSLRYLSNSYSWDELLAYILYEVLGEERTYLDLKYESRSQPNNEVDYPLLASKIGDIFDNHVKNFDSGKFSEVNDIFYKNAKEMDPKLCPSRFQIYISLLTGRLEWREGMKEEISAVKKARKNIGSIITTNYDGLVESLFEFSPLVGNNILLSNPFGSVYKIHGCYSKPGGIIINQKHYEDFETKYELIRAQMISLFVHHPIVFIGYSITDDNIRAILKTVFDYVDLNSEDGKKIQKNFLLLEYEKGSNSTSVSDYDVDLNGTNIRINKLKTDNFIALFDAIATLNLPISTMDIRRVQSIVREIYNGVDKNGNSIKVHVDYDIDNYNNGEKILAIGSVNNVKYTHKNTRNFISDYFRINIEDDKSYIKVIEQVSIGKIEWFPAYQFSNKCPEIEKLQQEKIKQERRIIEFIESVGSFCKDKAYNSNGVFIYNNAEDIMMHDNDIARSNKVRVLFYTAYKNPNFDIDSLGRYLENYLNNNSEINSDYRKMLCLYDYKISL